MQAFLQPLRIKSLSIPNRLVMAPMTRNRSPGHIPGRAVADYYRRRTEGGVGLIITEGTFVGHKAANGYPDVPSFCDEKAFEGWRTVVEEVHSAGGKIFPQLWHVGSVRQAHRHRNAGVDNPDGECCEEGNVPGYAPSKIPHPYVEDGEIPHEMSIEDIGEVIEAFAKAAQAAKMLGFDGVEIHGAHGYLIDQFFWSRTNTREDRYGGKELPMRACFAIELIEAVRKSVGPDFPIDFRFSQWKLGDYATKLATTPHELEAFLIPLAEAGVDLFHCSTRRFWEPEFPNSPLNLAGWTKKITGKPTITVGSIGLDHDFVSSSPPHVTKAHTKELLSRLENEEFDLVAVGRALIADPHWFHKINEGKEDEIVPFTHTSLQNYY